MHEAHYPCRPPDIPELLALLHSYRIRYVLVGSVAAMLYGVELQPGDFDITPALDQPNLQRLVALLVAIEARPNDDGGHWATHSNGERHWIAPLDPAAAQAAQARWQPDPADLSSLDHLFSSRYGNFDVVPDLSGSYDILIERAASLSAHGYQIDVMHINELLACVTVPRRAKDELRVRQLRQIQRQRTTTRRG